MGIWPGAWDFAQQVPLVIVKKFEVSLPSPENSVWHCHPPVGRLPAVASKNTGVSAQRILTEKKKKIYLKIEVNRVFCWQLVWRR